MRSAVARQPAGAEAHDAQPAAPEEDLDPVVGLDL